MRSLSSYVLHSLLKDPHSSEESRQYKHKLRRRLKFRLESALHDPLARARREEYLASGKHDMTLFKLLIPLLLRISHLVAADDSQIPISSSSKESSIDPPHRIAIIGGGAAGSSAAYNLRRFANDSLYDLPLNITLFESSSRIGGRTTTVNAFNDESLPVELGASIFVKANPILYNASIEFGLNARGYHVSENPTDSDFDVGIWDGTQFAFKQSSSDGRWQGYWDVVKLLWKYGVSPIRVQRLTQDMLGRFLQMYEKPVFPFKTLQGAVEEIELMHLMALTGEELMKEKGIGHAFSNDIIQASTRVNYAQNLNQIHGLESLVCMAIEGAMAVEGGNWQIFDEMVKRADAETVMGTTVTHVARDEQSGKYLVTTQDDSKHSKEPTIVDTVILAAPYQFANITFEPPLPFTPQEIDYVSLHVTLLTSPHLLSPTFFGLNEQTDVPSTILTTLPLKPPDAQDPNQFFSISTLRTIPAGKHSDKPQHLYKVFSSEPLKASLLAELYGFDFYPSKKDSPDIGIEAVSEEHISWYYHKLWHSYPYETPRTRFESMKLSGEIHDPRTGILDDGKGIWYTSGIESFISTMETSALMGANVAKLIVEEMDWAAPGPKLQTQAGEDGESESQVPEAEIWELCEGDPGYHGGVCGWCEINACICTSNEDYMSEWCVKHRTAEKVRETWLGTFSYMVRSASCRVESLARGRPSWCNYII